MDSSPTPSHSLITTPQVPVDYRDRAHAPRKLSVTVSIGLAERTEKAPDPESVIKAADKALYRAKKAGRNRVAK